MLGSDLVEVDNEGVHLQLVTFAYQLQAQSPFQEWIGMLHLDPPQSCQPRLPWLP